MLSMLRTMWEIFIHLLALALNGGSNGCHGGFMVSDSGSGAGSVFWYAGIVSKGGHGHLQ